MSNRGLTHRQWGVHGVTDDTKITKRMGSIFGVPVKEIKYKIECKPLGPDDLAEIEREMGTRVVGARYRWGLG